MVQPSNTANYSVTVTFSGGCTGTGTVFVGVNEASSKQLPAITICEGEFASILGQTTDVPGIYTLELQNAIGCDSIVTQELKVVPIKTIGVPAFYCPGDSVEVFPDEYYSTPAGLKNLPKQRRL